MTRRFLFSVALVAASALPGVASAQQADAPSAPAEDSGSPIYGYLAFAALAGISLMILCRSSRRS